MIAAILAAVLRILAVVSGVDTLVNIINGNTSQSAAETTRFLIQTNTNTTVNDLSDPTFGLAKLASNQAAILTAIATAEANILAAIGSPQQASTPVTLPSTPPAGYGSSGTGGGSGTVWGTNILTASYGNQTAGFLLSRIAGWVGAIAQVGPFVWRDQPLFYGYAGADVNNTSLPFFNRPNVAIGSVRPTDTVLSWLTREAPSFGWLQDSTQGGRVYTPATGTHATWVCQLFDGDLQQARAAAVAAGDVPPVWPGIASVTLGTSLALSDGLTIPGPLDGVIVQITSVAYPVSFYPFGAVKSFVKVGGIIFVDDNNQAEMAQPLGLEHDVICPRTMVRADHAILRLKSGTVGTVQPWVHV